MKRNLLAGLALMVFAFTGAAFTANKTLQANHYLQKPDVCEAIPQTNCNLTAPNDCEVIQGADTWRAHQTRVNSARCSTPLFRPN